MKFVDYINEMYTREQGKEYYVLPVNINRKAKRSVNLDAESARHYYAEEIVHCLLNFLCKHYKDSQKFFMIQKNRKENAETLDGMGYDTENDSDMKLFAYMLMKKLEPKYFNDDRCKDGTHAYIFIIDDKNKLANPHKQVKRSKKALYLKFSFIYNMNISSKEKYPSVGQNNYGDLVITPLKLILNQISVHSTRQSKK